MLIYVHCACVEYHLISRGAPFHIRVVIVCSGLTLTSVLRPAGILQTGDEVKMPLPTTHGSVGEFDSDVNEDDWETYVERVALYFTANGISDATKKRAILLSVCGAKTYRVIRDLVAPAKPTDISYDDIVSLVQKHFNRQIGGDDTEVQVQFKVPSGR